jgi:hypothetical protein
VTDTARVLLTAGLLSFATAAVFAGRLRRIAMSDPARLVGQLRLAQWAAVGLAALGGAPIGLAVAGAGQPLAHLDLTCGVAFAVLAGTILHQEPPRGLQFAAGGFVVHALVELAHRPGWLSPGLAPLWFTAGSATYDVGMAAVCFWATRR